MGDSEELPSPRWQEWLRGTDKFRELEQAAASAVNRVDGFRRTSEQQLRSREAAVKKAVSMALDDRLGVFKARVAHAGSFADQVSGAAEELQREMYKDWNDLLRHPLLKFVSPQELELLDKLRKAVESMNVKGGATTDEDRIPLLDILTFGREM